MKYDIESITDQIEVISFEVLTEIDINIGCTPAFTIDDVCFALNYNNEMEIYNYKPVGITNDDAMNILNVLSKFNATCILRVLH